MTRVAQRNIFSQMELAKSNSHTIKAINQTHADAAYYLEPNENVIFWCSALQES